MVSKCLRILHRMERGGEGGSSIHPDCESCQTVAEQRYIPAFMSLQDTGGSPGGGIMY